MYLLPSLFTVGNIAAGYFAITQTIAAISAQRRCAPPPGLGGDRDPVCDSVRCAGRAHCPHDQYHQRIRQGTGFAGGRDHVRGGAQPAGVYLGISFSAGLGQSRQLRQDLVHAGAFICFLFLIGGASRLARFNISHDAAAAQSGAAGPKVFCGHADSRRRGIAGGDGAFLAAAIPTRPGGCRLSGWSWWALADF